MKNKTKRFKLKMLFILLFVFVSIYTVNALTIIETTNDTDYDRIENNSIILGITKFKPNEVLTAGKASLATYNDMIFNKENTEYLAPKIYYYLQGSWFLIDEENNAIVITDESLIEQLNTQDIYYVNNEEKLLEVSYIDETSDKYDLVFESNDTSKSVKYENNILYVPAMVDSITVYLKNIENDTAIEMEKLVKENKNDSTFKVVKTEITGEDGEFKYAMLASGNIQLTRYLSDETEVVIPAEYDGMKVYSVGNPNAGTPSAQRYNIFGETDTTTNKTVTKITISEGIEVLEMAAFSGSTALTGEIVFPSTLKEIGAYAFNGCTKISGALDVPEGVTIIGRSAFQNCSSLKTLELPSTLVEIGPWAFNNCKGFTGDITIPDSVTTIGNWAFQNCTGFNGMLTLSKNLELIGDGAFNHCSKLTNTSVVIPKSVKTMGTNATEATHVFYDFANNTIKEFVVEEGNTSFKAIDGVLYTIDGIRMVAYPSSRDGQVYEMPEGVTIIDELAFSRAGSPWHVRDNTNTLKKLILPNSYVLTTELPSNYLNTGSNFSVAVYKYTGITDVEVKSDNPNYKTVNGVLYSKDGKDLWWIPVVKKGDVVIEDGVTTIKPGAIYTAWDRYQTSITIPASVTEIAESEIAELEILIRRKITITFGEGSIFEIKSDGTIGKK